MADRPIRKNNFIFGEVNVDAAGHERVAVLPVMERWSQVQPSNLNHVIFGSMTSTAFHNFDLKRFWNDSDYAIKAYIGAAPADELILSIEKELGYKLPVAYVELMKIHNGGIPFNTCFPTSKPTSWAADHIAISGVAGIGRTKTYSLCGERGSQFMIDEWGYPEIGICVCNCPSAGHDMIMLDYSACGKTGEPTVVHVDQESDYHITFLAENFESFIRGLVNKNQYE